MSSTSPDGLRSFIEQHGYLSWLNLQIDDIEHGRIRMTMQADEKLYNPGGDELIHGGIAATLIDTASGFALRTTFEDSTMARLATTDLNVSYLRPATDDLVVEAEVLRAGKTTGVTDVTVKNIDDDSSIAVGRTTYRLFRDS
ncbi:PaaI family thioesterase [Halalkalicoccus subterraneus]|uniref:PaaI family thioesterase n=1 Tax=Halalkalicoccus subterraneus TaxID=2675002 RepID=UPI000EFD0EBB|nr:PaaI family thioesterase [Halalkalicoccus subterraneus]